MARPLLLHIHSLSGVTSATSVVCTNGTTSSAVACEAGFYVAADGTCAGMAGTTHQSALAQYEEPVHIPA
jgi:hypothetical protein